jgi:CubicO group peptidase (beta-lactamase class C family)
MPAGRLPMLCSPRARGNVKYFLSAVLLAAGFAIFGEAQSANVRMKNEIDAIFSGATAPNAPGLAALVKKDGKIAFERGYGIADLHSKTPIDARTNFRLASVTKQFTAMAAMLLVRDGKLRYDETLTEIFPEFPAYGKTITVRNLLNHTSGLPDYEDLMEAEEKTHGKRWSAEKQIRDAEVLQLLEKQSAGKFAPGSRWEYSNSGYVVLGLVVAKASGKSFGDFLQTRIFEPLKMDHTLVFETGKNLVADRAYGHTKVGDTFEQTDQSSTSATLGDGGVYSNLEDLSKWDDALRKHTLLSEKEMQPALTPAQFSNGPQRMREGETPEPARGQNLEYGFGWFLDPYKNRARMWHYGETIGFKTAIQRFTKENLTIIVLCNRTDLDPGSLALKTADLFF